MLHDGARQIMKEHGADVREGIRARALRQRHAAGTGRRMRRPSSRCMPATRRTTSASAATISCFSQMALGAQLLRPRQWPPPRQPGRFPQFPEARADAQHPEHDRRLSGRADRHPPVGAPPRMHPRPRHADRQGVPHLFARQGAQCRRHRDRPHRARHLARAAARRAVGLHHHQHQLAAEARRADDGRHHPDVVAAARSSSSRPSRCRAPWRR